MGGHVPNRPRIYCPTCSSAARRMYIPEASAGKSPKNKVVPGWAYCTSCKTCIQVPSRRRTESNP